MRKLAYLFALLPALAFAISPTVGGGGTKTKKCLCTYDGTTAAWQDEISGTVGTTTSC